MAEDVAHARVVARYSELARTAMAGGRAVDCDGEVFDEQCFGAAAYSGEQAPASALRASLGCGNPVAVAELTGGETVLDLGSGAGLDVVLSARRVGPSGWVYGLDASADMRALARANAAQAGADNVEFLSGRIEEVPLPEAAVDVVLSNCVINLSADKPRVLAEAFRVLRPGGRFGISDVLATGAGSDEQRRAVEARVGCASTVTAAEYEALATAAGFTDVRITPTTDVEGVLQSAIVRAVKSR